MRRIIATLFYILGGLLLIFTLHFSLPIIIENSSEDLSQQYAISIGLVFSGFCLIIVGLYFEQKNA